MAGMATAISAFLCSVKLFFVQKCLNNKYIILPLWRFSKTNILYGYKSISPKRPKTEDEGTRV